MSGLSDRECADIVHASIAPDRILAGIDGHDGSRPDVLLTTVERIVAARESAVRADVLTKVDYPGVITTCREDGCAEQAEFILWGKLLPSDALGPRCYSHAVEHTNYSMPSSVDQWAVFDLRPLRYLIADLGSTDG